MRHTILIMFGIAWTPPFTGKVNQINHLRQSALAMPRARVLGNHNLINIIAYKGMGEAIGRAYAHTVSLVGFPCGKIYLDLKELKC